MGYKRELLCILESLSSIAEDGPNLLENLSVDAERSFNNLIEVLRKPFADEELDWTRETALKKLSSLKSHTVVSNPTRQPLMAPSTASANSSVPPGFGFVGTGDINQNAHTAVSNLTGQPFIDSYTASANSNVSPGFVFVGTGEQVNSKVQVEHIEVVCPLSALEIDVVCFETHPAPVTADGPTKTSTEGAEAYNQLVESPNEIAVSDPFFLLLANMVDRE